MSHSDAALLVVAGKPSREGAGLAAMPLRPTPSEMRSRIIEAAERLFRKFGYRKTTLADIALALSMSPANIYRFFRSKHAIDEAVCRRLLGDPVSLAVELAQRNATAEDRLRGFFSAIVRFNVEQFRPNDALHQLVATAAAEDWPALREYRDRMEFVLATIIADGMGRGEFPKVDARRAARCVCTSMLQHLHPTPVVRVDRGQASLDDMLNFCLAALRHGELSQD